MIQSVVASYVLNQLFALILNAFSVHSNNLLAPVAFSLAVSYAICRLIDKRAIQKLFDKIGIRRTLNNSIWCDLIDSESRNFVKVYDDDGFYVGTCVNFEDDQREPYIILEGYERCDLAGNTIVPANLTGDRRMLFNLKDFKRVEVVYDNLK